MESIIIEGRPAGFPSVFIFKSGVWSIQLQQRDTIFFKTVGNPAGRMLMDCPNHGPTHRSAQGMARLFLRSDCQNKAALPDDDFISIDFDCLGTQIGGKAVFFSVQKHDADDSSEMKSSQRDIRDGEHQCATRETALCPGVFAWERMTPVSLNISDGILEHIGRLIDGKRPIHRVTHAENAVPALYEGNIPKWPHDVVLDGREGTKPNRTSGMEVRSVDVQRNALFSKATPGNVDLTVVLVKIRVGERNMEGLRIGYQLYGAEFGFTRTVNRRNDSECLQI